MILVTGASGTNGREVVSRLASSGAAVRALVRDPSKARNLKGPRVEVVTGDLSNPASLDAALEGVDHAFFLSAVSEDFPDLFAHFLAAALRAGRIHVVKFSGLGASADSPSILMRQHGATDDSLIASGLPYTILRANSFFQNLLWSAATIKSQDAFYLPIGDAHQSLVDVRDIADVAVLALTTPGHEGQIYEITGPESLTYHDLAAQLSRAVGKPIRYAPVPPEAAYESLRSIGSPEWNARAVVELYGVFAAGHAATVTDTIATLTGHPPINFGEWAAENAAAFV